MKDRRMKDKGKRELMPGLVLLAGFIVWTILIRHIDVQRVGPRGTEIGVASFNVWFHRMTGVHMLIYTITDWLGLVPIFICMGFGLLGLVQWIKRRSLLRVDPDILLLGVYYLVVIFGYLLFEMVPINYRPILIEGYLEASYPSSTTLLVLSVMPTLKFQADRRVMSAVLRKSITIFVIVFSVFMVIGRLISGVHWATDIIGSVLLSSGLFMIYRFMAEYFDFEKPNPKPEARKSRSMTQEELAEALFVSRTAISKWESGRGYPSIDSLKEISRYFSVTIDDLICSDEMISVAENEKREFIEKYVSLICNALDILLAILLFIPAFGNGRDSPETVSLFDLSGINPPVKIVFAVIIGVTILNGICGVIIANFNKPVWNRHRLVTGIILSILAVTVFIVARQPYAGIVSFSFLVIKGFLITKAKQL